MKECKVFLKPKKEESLLRFHPWVFSGAIQTIEGEPEEGDLVEVYGTNGRFLGIGHYQIGSIAVRILSFKPVTIDAAFWEERIRIAYTLRQTLELAGVETTIHIDWYMEKEIIFRDLSSTCMPTPPSCRRILSVCTMHAIRLPKP